MSDSQKLQISAKVAEKIREHGVETYPHECCGALLGHDEGVRKIVDLFPLVNRREDSPHNRFSVEARDVLEAELAAQSRGLDLLGWYHSHPDHPARPSEYDREHAWPWYSYIIVSVQQRLPQDMTSWRLNEDRAAYTQETVEIGGETAAFFTHPTDEEPEWPSKS
jgi:proteasome lid subunit RPN8/RPN11